MFNKKSTLEKKTSKIVKKVSKTMKKNPTAAVAVGGGIITAGIGSIVTSITLGSKIKKLQKGNTTPKEVVLPEEFLDSLASEYEQRKEAGKELQEAINRAKAEREMKETNISNTSHQQTVCDDFTEVTEDMTSPTTDTPITTKLTEEPVNSNTETDPEEAPNISEEVVHEESNVSTIIRNKSMEMLMEMIGDQDSEYSTEASNRINDTINRNTEKLMYLQKSIVDAGKDVDKLTSICDSIDYVSEDYRLKDIMKTFDKVYPCYPTSMRCVAIESFNNYIDTLMNMEKSLKEIISNESIIEEPVVEENPKGYPAKKQNKKNSHKK